VQPLDLGDDERLVGGVLERFAPPEPESFTDGAERVVGARPAGLFQVAAGRCDQALESEQVDGLGGNVEHVAAGHRSQSRNVPTGGKPERPSEVRDVHLKGVGGFDGRCSPHSWSISTSAGTVRPVRRSNDISTARGRPRRSGTTVRHAVLPAARGERTPSPPDASVTT
jgi:hypothetical protein